MAVTMSDVRMSWNDVVRLNRERGTKFTKLDLDLHNAALRRGLLYDYECETFECPTCGDGFLSLAQAREEHFCNPRSNITLGDFVSKHHNPMAELDALFLGGNPTESTSVELEGPSKMQVQFESQAPASPIIQELIKPTLPTILVGSIECPTNDAAKHTRSTTVLVPQATQVQASKPAPKVDAPATRCESVQVAPLQITPSCVSIPQYMEDAYNRGLATPIKRGKHALKTRKQSTKRPVKMWIAKCDLKYSTEPDSEVSMIQQDYENRPNLVLDEIKRPAQATSKSQKRSRQPKLIVKMGGTQFDAFLKQLIKTLRSKNMKVQFVEKSKIDGTFVEYKQQKLLQVQLKHHKGIRARRDIHIRRTDSLFFKVAKMVAQQKWNCDKFDHGSSGFVINNSLATGKRCSTQDDLLIIRGRERGTLLDARSKYTEAITYSLTHYSTADLFWRGFDKTFQATRLAQRHRCQSDVPVEECGSVLAALYQVIHPCWKVTCQECIAANEARNGDEHLELMQAQYKHNQVYFDTQLAKFPSISKILVDLIEGRERTKPEVASFKEVVRLVGDRTEAPFTHINAINEFLVKGSPQTNEELVLAQQHLLEIARFLKNRTDLKKFDSVQIFRNKISQKAHMNLTLMCDNQLDSNGNFVWGKRGYHAKRFFSNFFEEIDMAKGYKAYEKRPNPNGIRRLSINNLIIKTDPTQLRKQLRGDPVTLYPITKSCISKQEENIRYACSCVTTDDGKPLLSELIMPTKNHLVIGNSGDSKFLDLPAEINEKLYIAKTGYCYLNIFLAMLVNIDESQAKDFTKVVRDTVIPELGEWPSMMDLSTMCVLLTVLFPATAGAELPRILVDHENQILHVVDSYGSMNVGYHVLKANTVSQLIKFASDSLESDIKHYKVGGVQEVECSTVLTLIRCVYRPKLMRKVIEEEPYLLVLSMTSPTVLCEMFVNGYFEEAVDKWIQKDQTLATMSMILSALASKVSCAESLFRQRELIAQTARPMVENISKGARTSLSCAVALHYLTVLEAEHDADSELVRAGYVQFTELFERTERQYKKILALEWKGLSWCGQFYCARHSSWWRQIGIVRSRKPTAIMPTNPLSGLSFSACIQAARKQLKTTTSFIGDGSTKLVRAGTNKVWCAAMSIPRYMFPDLFSLVSTVNVILTLAAIAGGLGKLLHTYNSMRQERLEREKDEVFRQLDAAYTLFCRSCDEEELTEENFRGFLRWTNPKVCDYYESHLPAQAQVLLQAKSKDMQQLEQIIACVTLLLMVFDTERSDCLYRTLSKFKGIITSCASEPVKFQALDTIDSLEVEKNMTVDFEIETEKLTSLNTGSITFGDWWANQLECGNTNPHYRTEGQFLEFTRATTVAIAMEIATSANKNFLVRGAVGSGKSTGLPASLAKFGKVLLLEPTRPLAENVHAQLQGEPFTKLATLRIRNKSIFGSDPIHIMTSGFALHHLAHNASDLSQYEFIMIDECHVNDAASIAFNNLLVAHQWKGKLLKVSATPPGREVEFSTQYPVKIKCEGSLGFEEFVVAQGSGANADVVSNGQNILVYVASYNEVDRLSDLLIKKNYKVTKVDGRTMKNGAADIKTSGTEKQPHFVVATNIIENGVTLDIDTVVDFGVKILPLMDSDNRLISYQKVPISYGERVQRLGRVGRFKEGVALRIGETRKGLCEIPEIIATEAALYCFMYNLPVTTQSVSTNTLRNCTRPQALTMANFELSPFYMVHLVNHDGAIHPEIHKLFTAYKLRDSEVVLSPLAIPNRSTTTWLTSRQYSSLAGCRIEEHIRIPFLVKDVPERLHIAVWQTIEKFKHEAGPMRLNSAQVSKVAYTLKTDVHSIPRTLAIVERLLENEMRKKAHFESVTGNTCQFSNFSLQGVLQIVRARYTRNFTQENIEKLQRVQSQLREFANLAQDENAREVLQQYGYLDLVTFQTEKEVASRLALKGVWNKELATKDLLVSGTLFVGGLWMLLSYFGSKAKEPIQFQGKRKMQKLKFRDAHDKKMGRVVEGDEAAEHYFGDAYTKKGKGKGRTHGMGKTKRKFVSMYGFDPTDFSFIRYVDPVTGMTLDESVYTDVLQVQQRFNEVRSKQVEEGELELERIRHFPSVQAYVINEITNKALKVDLTPHIPLKVCNTASIAKFPERENELRQTGPAVPINIKDVPAANEGVEFEGASKIRGLRDYNPISSVICRLTNASDGGEESLYGLGYSQFIITNKHLFRCNNGTLTIQSQHGTYLVKNSTQIQQLLVKDRDIIILKLPKDFPPFPRKLKFRAPIKAEKVCLVSTNFQTKSASSLVSETSVVFDAPGSTFWKHWITTKDGQCGNPLVSVSDGHIIGIHSSTSLNHDQNYLTAFPDDFESQYLVSQECAEWTKGWKFNIDSICWGNIELKQSAPEPPFVTEKIIRDLYCDGVVTQSERREKWVLSAVHTNLQPVAESDAQLVTKHVVKGKCPLFANYLSLHEDAATYFKPLMGAYQPSRLNREAYLKDILKYAKPIPIGDVNCETFEIATSNLVANLEAWGFSVCGYVTDEEAIFNALNMKSAVGALYKGKKREYFESFTEGDKEEILRESCKRLYLGKLGVWNGSLKAELRPIEKVQENKTRTFTAAPIDTLLAGKVCVDDFNNQFYSMCIKCPWTVGMTKFYKGWDELMNKLPNDWIYCDADGSQFDSSLSPYLINAILQVRLHFMEDWDVGEQMLSNLYTEIVHTPILTPDGTILKKHKGNNSGQPSTVVDNTLMVILAMEYTFIKTGVTHDLCKFFVNGDDLIIAIHPSVADRLEQFSDIFATLGLNYDFSNRVRDKTELWFMSHRAMNVEGILIPKLEPERIVSILEWDRSTEPAHRLEAICASMIEAWGYTELLQHIRRFYAWCLEQAPYNQLATEGRAPYLAETALRKLYLDADATEQELEKYYQVLVEGYDESYGTDIISFQSGTVDAGQSTTGNKGDQDKGKITPAPPRTEPDSSTEMETSKVRDRDVDVGSRGTFTVPRLRSNASKIQLPRTGKGIIVNLDHLLIYKPEQVDISNTRASREQLEHWTIALMKELELSEEQLKVVLNGFMVWCIENGTSVNINGFWTMMDGDEQVLYPLKPFVENARPTLRQIMAHFSNLAEAYIEMRGREEPYMPRYGRQRNLTDMSLARCAFDFYEITSKTSNRVREAHIQMKAAAVRNGNNRLFGLDGNVGAKEEDTERHTTEDVSRNMHSLFGMRQ